MATKSTKKTASKKISDKEFEKRIESKIEKGVEKVIEKKINNFFKCDDKKDKCKCKPKGPCHGSALYFFGFLGAAVYYISTATGFWNGVLGFLKACIWPAFLVFELLRYLGA